MKEQRIKEDLFRMEKIKFKLIKGYVDDEQLWKLQKCLVCESVSFCDTKIPVERMERIGLREITVRRIQERHFFVKVPNEELMDILKQNDWSYLKEFFVSIEPWSENEVLKERVVWIEI